MRTKFIKAELKKRTGKKNDIDIKVIRRTGKRVIDVIKVYD